MTTGALSGGGGLAAHKAAAAAAAPCARRLAASDDVPWRAGAGHPLPGQLRWAARREADHAAPGAKDGGDDDRLRAVAECCADADGSAPS
jgi:hypothetical protein